MTHDDWVKWIRRELVAQASEVYPNNPQLQMIYTIGFLEAQLAQAFRTDSRVYDSFKRAIESAQVHNQELK